MPRSAKPPQPSSERLQQLLDDRELLRRAVAKAGTATALCRLANRSTNSASRWRGSGLPEVVRGWMEDFLVSRSPPPAPPKLRRSGSPYTGP